MTDLETHIRDALRERGDSIVPTRTRLEPRASRAPRLMLVAATVLIVLAIVVPLALVRGGDGGTRPAAGDGSFVGAKWRVTAIDDRYGHLAVSAEHSGYVAFASDGTLAADDGVNFYAGSYRLTGNGYRPGAMGGTLAGYAGPADSPQGRLIAALGAIATGGPRSTGDVPAAVSDDTLVAGQPPVTVTLVRVGAYAPPGSPSLSASSTAS